MKLFRSNPNKSKAQAMVEFAIALPILLLLLYGILETGRLLFIYSSVVTASRQASRYGSATGEGISNTVPRYQDCQGMRAAANDAAYINTLDNSEIDIQYDGGPGTTATNYCSGTTDTSLTSGILSDNKHRVVVTVNDQFDPILPNLIPFLSRTISATSSRTVLISVSIVVTAPPSTWQASTPTFTASPTRTPTRTPTATRTFTPSPTLQFTYTPSGTSTITRTPTVTRTPTQTLIPPTALPLCDATNVTPGLLVRSGNSLTMNINNQTGANLEIERVIFQWNHDKGHQLGTDKTLVLKSASLGGVTFWSGDNTGPSSTIPSPAVTIPVGTSTITFTFHQSFDNWDGTEFVEIYLLNPACLSPIYQSQH